MAQIGLRVKHQVSMFVKGPVVEASGSMMIELYSKFQKAGYNLIPSTFQELDISTGQLSTRLKLLSPESGLEISFSSGRTDVLVTPIDDVGSNVGEFTDFSKTALNCFEIIEEMLPRRSTRVAAFSQILMAKMTDAELQAAFRSAFVPSGLHDETNPVEWNARIVSRFPSQSLEGETINAVSTLARVSGEFRLALTGTKFDTISLEIDVNTLADSTNERFTVQTLAQFITEASRLLGRLAQDRLKGID